MQPVLPAAVGVALEHHRLHFVEEQLARHATEVTERRLQTHATVGHVEPQQSVGDVNPPYASLALLYGLPCLIRHTHVCVLRERVDRRVDGS